MIQPQLTAYSFSSTEPSGISAEPALLDVMSIAPERILLLDAYFYVVIFHGATVAQWRKAEYHLLPEHRAFAELLAAPHAVRWWWRLFACAAGLSGDRLLHYRAGDSNDIHCPRALRARVHQPQHVPHTAHHTTPCAGVEAHRRAPLPRAARGGLRPERQPGALPARQAQPQRHLQQQPGGQQRGDHDGRRQPAGVHGPPQALGGAVVSLTGGRCCCGQSRCGGAPLRPLCFVARVCACVCVRLSPACCCCSRVRVSMGAS